MKLLFDHNLSPKLVNELRDLFPDSNHLYNLGLDKEDDQTVWNYAKENDFTVVTKDSDFNDLSMLLGYPPKLIWIRTGNCKTSEIKFLLRQHKSNINLLSEKNDSGLLILV